METRMDLNCPESGCETMHPENLFLDVAGRGHVSSGPGWNQLLTAKELAATRNVKEQVLWMHRLASTFWTIRIHSCLHIPFINSRPESKAVCLENARSLMFL